MCYIYICVFFGFGCFYILVYLHNIYEYYFDLVYNSSLNAIHKYIYIHLNIYIAVVRFSNVFLIIPNLYYRFRPFVSLNIKQYFLTTLYLQ